MSSESVNPGEYTMEVVKSPSVKKLARSWASLNDPDYDDSVATPDEYSVTFTVIDENGDKQKLRGGAKKLEYEGFSILVDLIDQSGEVWEINFRQTGPDRGTGTAINPAAMRLANRPKRRA